MSATINHNKRHNGIEIRFSVRPPEEDLTWLHSNGYRWSMQQKVWYRKYSESDYNKAMARFRTGSNTSASSDPSSQPVSPKQLTQTEILQAGGRELEDLWNISHLTLAQFVQKKFHRIDITGFDTPFMWDTKQGKYANLPAKRKRPDYYNWETMLSVIQNHVLNRKLIIPLKAIFSLKNYHSMTSDSLKYLLRDHPQLLQADDYPQIAEQITENEQAYKAEYEKWQTIREKYFKVGQIVWKKNEKTGEAEKWKVPTLKISYYPGHICSLIELQMDKGYIVFMGEQRLSSIYLENPKENPSAKVFTELLPELEAKQDQPENTHEKEKAIARLRLLKLKLSLMKI